MGLSVGWWGWLLTSCLEIKKEKKELSFESGAGNIF